jgi:hypothetical protein
MAPGLQWCVRSPTLTLSAAEERTLGLAYLAHNFDAAVLRTGRPDGAYLFRLRRPIASALRDDQPQTCCG